jgi:hypothetical protein
MRHNFGGEPLLNAFVGLMFVAGLLVAISRFAQRRYRVLLMLFIVFLAPAAISVVGLPNAAHAAAVLPVVAVLAAVGVSYMLELWYATFPINSAARTTGQAVIIVLLALTLFQGYTQYFRAWAGSTETYAAYNEPAVAVAKFVQAEPAKTIFYAVAQSDELPVVAYLNNYINDESRYIPLTPGQVAGVPLGGTKQFVITAAARDEAAKSLSLKFPGGKLRPYTSAFSQDEIYYTYEMTP